MNILDALKNLDTLDNDHWTKEGDPRIDVVSSLLGRTVTRQEIIDASPKFNRENPLPQEEGSVAPERNSLRDFLSGEITDRNFTKFLVDIPSDELESTTEILSMMLEDTLERIRQGEALKMELKRCIGLTNARIRREIPDMTNQDAIRAYIQSEAHSRGVRFQKTKEIAELIDLKNIDPRAPIDAAMARRTARGTKRPVR